MKTMIGSSLMQQLTQEIQVGHLLTLSSGKIVGINAMSIKDSEGLNFAVPLPPVCKAISFFAGRKTHHLQNYQLVLQQTMFMKSILP